MMQCFKPSVALLRRSKSVFVAPMTSRHCLFDVRSFATSYMSRIPGVHFHDVLEERHWKLETGKEGEGNAYFSLCKDSEDFSVFATISREGADDFGFCSYLDTPGGYETFRDRVNKLLHGSTENYSDYKNARYGLEEISLSLLSNKGFLLNLAWCNERYPYACYDYTHVILSQDGMRKFSSLAREEIDDTMKDWLKDARARALEHIRSGNAGVASDNCEEYEVPVEYLVKRFDFTEEELGFRPED